MLFGILKNIKDIISYTLVLPHYLLDGVFILKYITFCEKNFLFTTYDTFKRLYKSQDLFKMFLN